MLCSSGSLVCGVRPSNQPIRDLCRLRKLICRSMDHTQQLTQYSPLFCFSGMHRLCLHCCLFVGYFRLSWASPLVSDQSFSTPFSGGGVLVIFFKNLVSLCYLQFILQTGCLFIPIPCGEKPVSKVLLGCTKYHSFILIDANALQLARCPFEQNHSLCSLLFNLFNSGAPLPLRRDYLSRFLFILSGGCCVCRVCVVYP
ncbi:hypothetical protein CRM22_004398 [Opisthorchis felineus]|uniref:Uncharacterized protein n=1 Tax=Opisthorchis felineus TaxID=147828 RepID=A0A4S2M1P9_OPIFE|nr:hypothetical protein CRM22_004398 [Opisthorchis felineus]